MAKSSYDNIAGEYYDPRHITSRNFDHATRAALSAHPFHLPGGLILELGAGRGRAREFLNADPQSVVQLDYSEVMLALKEREPALLKVHADACAIPLFPQQFAAVVGFLIDPFFGLQCLHEAHRMLVSEGRLLVTVPTAIWGTALRRQLRIDEMTTRFKKVDGESQVVLPSVLHHPDRIRQMMEVVGFTEVQVLDHCLATGEPTISPDITAVAQVLNQDVWTIPVIHSIRAKRA